MPKQTAVETVQQTRRRLTGRNSAAKIAEARAEYAELRKIAVKRIQRAQARGELANDAMPIKTKDIPQNDAGALAKAIRDVQRFLSSKRSTAAGRSEIRSKTVQTLKEIGFENVNERNAKLFGDYMEMWRRKYEQDTPDGRKMLFDSDKAVEIFDTISERFTNKTNVQSMSRMFNDYLRAEGQEDLIVYL